jgi:hypothetical protein
MFKPDTNSILPQAIADFQKQLKQQGFDGSQSITMNWAPTTLVSQEINKSNRFKGVLKDNMGLFKADIRRKDKQVKIYFEGVGTREMSLEQARYEFDMMWDCLAKQGHKLLVVA